MPDRRRHRRLAAPPAVHTFWRESEKEHLRTNDCIQEVQSQVQGTNEKMGLIIEHPRGAKSKIQETENKLGMLAELVEELVAQVPHDITIRAFPLAHTFSAIAVANLIQQKGRTHYMLNTTGSLYRQILWITSYMH